MANYTKTHDANHLVTIGYEGFWGEYDTDVQYNPGNGWAGITGQNFSRNMAHAEIDFAEIHYWPDEWFANQEDITYDATQFLTAWFTQHAIVANNLGKPLLLEEFGKAVNVSLLLKLLIPPPCLPFCLGLRASPGLGDLGPFNAVCTLTFGNLGVWLHCCMLTQQQVALLQQLCHSACT